MTTIVVPVADVVADADKLLEALLFSIKEQEIDKAFRVVLCYDSCREEFIDLFAASFGRSNIDHLVYSGNRRNFAGNANMGLRYVHTRHKDSALVVNQDCVLPAVKHLKEISGKGLVVPSQIQVCSEPPISTEELQKIEKCQPKRAVKGPQTKLTGFCMYIAREVMDSIGYFDEYFKASFEDDDYCARALLAGFPVEHVNVAVHHYVSRCGAYDPSKLGLNLIKYRLKWGIPKDIPHEQCNQWIIDNHDWNEAMRVS